MKSLLTVTRELILPSVKMVKIFKTNDALWKDVNFSDSFH